MNEIWVMFFGKRKCAKLQLFATMGYVSVWKVFTGVVGGG
jgi:hypothetical protein